MGERSGFGELIERHLADVRGKNTQLPLAESHLTRRLFARMLRKVAALPVPTA